MRETGSITIISRLRAALQRMRKLLIFSSIPDWSAAVDRDTSEMLYGSRFEIVAPDLDFSVFPMRRRAHAVEGLSGRRAWTKMVAASATNVWRRDRRGGLHRSVGAR